MHRLETLAENLMRDKASGIERRVLEGADEGGAPVVGARHPRQTPACRR